MPTWARLTIATVTAFAMLYLCSLHWLAGPFLAAAVLGSVITAQKIDLWLTERRERAFLIEQAELQHAAWLAGDDDWGVYGISPVADTEPHTERACS
jgi:hypothetical protein